MNKRLALCLSLVLLTGFAASTAFAQAEDGPVGTTIDPGSESAPPAAAGNTAGNEPGTTPANNTPQDGGGQWMMLLLIGLLIAMFVFSSRSRKKQEAKRREMLDAIKKGDTVTSIGGIIGTVVEVRDRDVLVKIDDSTRIKLARWAIRGVGEDSVNEVEKKDGQK